MEACETVAGCLKRISEGGEAPRPFHCFEDVARAHDEFVAKLYEDELMFCPLCKEATLRPVGDVDACPRCRRDRDARFTEFNGMNPLAPGQEIVNPAERVRLVERFHALEKMTPVEELLIARAQPVMRLYRLRGGGVGYKGCCINLRQDVATFARTLPRAVSETEVFIVRKCTVDDPIGYKDFRVRREVVRYWLLFLRDANPFYRDVVVDDEAIARLPMDATVERELAVLEDDEVPHAGDHAGAEEIVGREPVVAEGEPVAGDGDTGAEDGDAVAESSVGSTTGRSERGTVLARLRRALPQVPWPAVDPQEEPLNEYGTQGLQSLCFPTLFPFGTGDHTHPATHDVEAGASFRHLLWYAVPQEGGRFAFPFAAHSRWCHWAQDMEERRKIN